MTSIFIQIHIHYCLKLIKSLEAPQPIWRSNLISKFSNWGMFLFSFISAFDIGYTGRTQCCLYNWLLFRRHVSASKNPDSLFTHCYHRGEGEGEGRRATNQTMEVEAQLSSNTRKALLVLSCVILSIGHCGGPLVMRLYFVRGGERIWFSSWLETAGWPLILVPLIITYMHRRTKQGSHAKLFFMKPPLFVASAVIGVLTALDDYLYAYGVAKLPVSTIALIIASQLAFTAAFAFLLVKQKFTSYSVNAIFLLSIGAGVLALHTSSDRPANESNKEYYLGFFMTLAAAALYGFILPLVELTYKKAKQAITYSLVMEIQMVMCFFATVFCTVGMLVNNDFQVHSSFLSTQLP